MITTPFTFVATSKSIIYNQCTPVFSDIKEDTCNIDPESIRKKITKNTQALIYVDYAGQPCDIDEIKEIADEFDLYLIEDASHALGAEYKNKKVGSLADMTTFSFHPVKHITTGEGGAVTTQDARLYERLSVLRNHGIDRDGKARHSKTESYHYDMTCLGRNYRITDFQCALGLSQLKRLDEFIGKRQALADQYNEVLTGAKGIITPHTKEDVRHAWHLYTVRVAPSERDRIFREMRKAGIGVNVHYIPAYHFTYYMENFDIKRELFPATEKVFAQILTLPLHPLLSESEVDHVCRTLKKIVH